MQSRKRFDPRSFDAWARFLAGVMRRRQADLIKIFDAASVRELWLQGEILLAAKRRRMPFLYVNCGGIKGYGGAADLSYWSSHRDDAKLHMLAELKFLGKCGYFAKDFCGKAVRDLAGKLGDGKKLIVSPTSPVVKNCIGGLVGDYKRLLSYRAAPDVLKMLVLVLDTRGEKLNALGRLLDAIEFERAGKVVFQDAKADIMCEAWQVCGHC